MMTELEQFDIREMFDGMPPEHQMILVILGVLMFCAVVYLIASSGARAATRSVLREMGPKTMTGEKAGREADVHANPGSGIVKENIFAETYGLDASKYRTAANIMVRCPTCNGTWSLNEIRHDCGVTYCPRCRNELSNIYEARA